MPSGRGDQLDVSRFTATSANNPTQNQVTAIGSPNSKLQKGSKSKEINTQIPELLKITQPPTAIAPNKISSRYAKASNTPEATTIPRPPVNLRNRDQLCPAMAKRGAPINAAEDLSQVQYV